MASFYEFFAGGGMARLGLGPDWECLFANDISPKKVDTYVQNFGENEIVCGDIYKLSTKDLPGEADLAWGSFPCQDLSLAGNGAGLAGERSGTFNKLIALLAGLKRERRLPQIVVIENVVGSITSHNGKDFEAILGSLTSLGYYVGPMIIDGSKFVPQSRPRLFVVAAKISKRRFSHFITKLPDTQWHSKRLIESVETLPDKIRRKCIWWRLPSPPPRTSQLVDVLELEQDDVPLMTEDEISTLMGMMSENNLSKLESAIQSESLIVGGLYKRMREQKDGTKQQRAEVRFDGIAGCLRTPGGGSSRQTIILAGNGHVNARLLSRREAARLMGLPDGYVIPERYNDAYHVFGDGLVVPVVSWIEANLLSPLINEMTT